MPSIFTRIVQGEIPCHKVAEDQNHFAFLDINPLAKGHTLVIPKKEVDYVFDLTDNELQALHLFAKKVSKAIKATIQCNRIGVCIIGLEVPHAHIHLIPLQSFDTINFTAPKLAFDNKELSETAARISSHF